MTSLLRSTIFAQRLWSKKAYGFRKWNGAHACISTIGHNASIDMDLPENFDRKTRIICTVGPSTWSKEGMHGLLQRGMNVLRLNFSHGTHEQKAEVITSLRSLLVDIRQAGELDFSDGSREDFCAIAADTKGPEIRTGILGGNIQNVELKVGHKSSYRWTLHTKSRVQKI